MHLDRYKQWLLAALWLLTLATSLRAQTVAAPATKGTKESDRSTARGPAVVERVEPDIYYIRDKNDDLVPLLNYTLDDIKKLVELRDNPASAPRAAFRMERLAGHAEAVGSYAKVSLDLSIVPSNAGWVRVPLRLGNFVLTELPTTKGNGEQLVDFDPESREYVAWFRGQAGEPHPLSLRGLVSLESDGGQTRFKLNAPRAVVSELELLTPLANAVGQMTAGGVLTATEHTPSGTMFRATGLANDFLLTWREAEAPRGPSATALSVEGQIISTIDGGGVDTEATLKVSAFGREFNRFQLRLPRGAALIPAETADYTVAEVVSPAADEGQSPRKLVEVRLKAKTTAPVSVKLTTNQRHDVTGEGTFDLGGFDCLGAVRQSGHLAVRVEGDWQVTFVRRQGVLQTDNLPAEMKSDAVVARFFYFGQPFSLPVRVTSRQTRTAVQPRFVVRVSSHQLQLDARLKYYITGAKGFSLSLDLNDWQLDVSSLEPALLINSDALVVKGNLALITLKQATTGELDLRFRATRHLPPEATAFDFRLPRLSADTSAAAELAVWPDDNVMLSPRNEEMSGFSIWTPESDFELPAHRQTPWFYQSDVPDPRFTADFQVASRRLTTRVEARVAVAPSAAKVKETLFCNIAHEAADSLLLRMPAALAQAEGVEIRCRGNLLVPEPVVSEQPPDDDSVVVRVHLPEALFGPFQIDVAFDWSDSAMDDLTSQAATVKLDLPLVMPGEGEFNRCEVQVVVEKDVEVSPIGSGWTLDRHERASIGEPALTLSASQPHTQIALGVSAQGSVLNDSVVVERAWIQTWLTDYQRIDRAVLRFRCRDGQLGLRLPPRSRAEMFRLDNEVVPALSQGETPDERVLPVPESGMAGDSHVLEMTYELPQRQATWGTLTLPMPAVLRSAGAHPVYWQVLLSQNEFLLCGPAALAGDFDWKWQTVAWRRQPARETGELEIWSGAGLREEPLPSSLNPYLFSGMQLPAQLEITTISRMELVLLASGVVLAAGLVWIYVPRVRRPQWLFVLAVAVLAAAAEWPDLALMFVQAGVLGVLLVLVAVVLERRVAQPPRRVFRSGPSSIVGRGSTNTAVRPPSSTPASTRTAAVAMELQAKAQP